MDGSNESGKRGELTVSGTYVESWRYVRRHGLLMVALAVPFTAVPELWDRWGEHWAFQQPWGSRTAIAVAGLVVAGQFAAGLLGVMLVTAVCVRGRLAGARLFLRRLPQALVTTLTLSLGMCLIHIVGDEAVSGSIAPFPVLEHPERISAAAIAQVLAIIVLELFYARALLAGVLTITEDVSGPRAVIRSFRLTSAHPWRMLGYVLSYGISINALWSIPALLGSPGSTVNRGTLVMVTAEVLTAPLFAMWPLAAWERLTVERVRREPRAGVPLGAG
jgi:hypothetical protein